MANSNTAKRVRLVAEDGRSINQVILDIENEKPGMSVQDVIKAVAELGLEIQPYHVYNARKKVADNDMTTSVPVKSEVRSEPITAASKVKTPVRLVTTSKDHSMSDNQNSAITSSESLSHKVDFAIVFRVRNANPNGDPLNGNRPRVDYAGFGEVTDVCLKRKIRNRLLEQGQAIYVQSDDYRIDEYRSLKERADGVLGNKLGSSEMASVACATWYDVRAFGQLFAFKGPKVKDEADTGVSVGIRGPVSIHSAFSIAPITITSTQITKSVSGEGDGTKKSSDTMGMKHRVDDGIYVTYGSINPQLAERTGFSDTDANILKGILPKLFENDASSARPEGSMEVLKIIWYEHNCKSGQYSSSKVHKSITVNANGEIDIAQLEGLEPELLPGF